MTSLPAVSTRLTEAEYETIEAAVTETARGRWFLAEYARRNRTADTRTLLVALDRIEAVVRGERTVEAVDRIRFDLIEMAKAIARTKAEIAAIKPDVAHQGKIGMATEELDSIVATTESATSEILAAAENIQEYAWTLRERGVEADICDVLDARATEIYTACSFQDLTGQRTRKVVQALRFLEGRINAMIDIWGVEDLPSAQDEPATETSGRALLNGPARPGEGLNQSDVDMVMGPAAPAHAADVAQAPDATASSPPEAHRGEAAAAEASPLPQSLPSPHPAAMSAPARPPETAQIEAISAVYSVEPGVPDPFPPPDAAFAPDATPPAQEAAHERARDCGLSSLAPIMALGEEERVALFS